MRLSGLFHVYCFSNSRSGHRGESRALEFIEISVASEALTVVPPLRFATVQKLITYGSYFHENG